MSLRYLNFDYAEGTDGTGTLEAMASIWPEQTPAVHAEIAKVLTWAHAEFPGRRGPLDEGFDWDYDLHGLREITAPEAVHYDEVTRQISVEAGPAGKPRHTLTLSLSGTPVFCEAFIQQFGLNAD
ncbi:hypothetical protein SAMN05216350_10370 [Polaromonas sp. YR568]|uniref:hypothetical protein n=1 Tax=Polaromonas sp. YR568 TaxID=1855301 RepID=UPI0008EF4869|nr:hypothetical protein [Polaromonas sp. YR568]SFU60395.1 hypothetical protein SAMN05216350_10370 [Polaromonas sp. YR568]